MQIASETLISELQKQTRDIIYRADKFANLSDTELNWRPAANKWSILECLQHLNLYGDYYLPAIKENLASTKHITPVTIFKSGTIGNYMANSMKPGPKMKKMKTPADKNPLNSSLDVAVIKNFIGQQNELLDLLEESRLIDIQNTKIPISLTKYLKLRLGDIFRFTVHHNDRHIVQAENVASMQTHWKHGR